MNSTKTYKPKLFVVLSRFPYPIDKGDKLRAYYQIRDLSQKWDIYLHCLSESGVSQQNKSELSKFCTELHVHQLKKWKIYLNCAMQLFGKKPIQTAYFYQRSIHKKIKKSINTIQPDHIFCQLIRASEYVKNYHNCPKTLDYMDALSEGMKKRIASSSLFTKWFFKLEWKRLLRYESLIYDYFEKHTIISNQDRQLLALPNKNQIQVIPNGVGEHFFEFQYNQKTNFELVFVGNLSYPPNIFAVEFITQKLIPEAKKQGFDWKVLISGANPSVQMLQLQNENIQIEGWVDDIRTSYAKGKIFIAPMFIGTGLQNKILEAMAMAKPCITTALAKNAFEMKISILTAEDTLQYIEEINILLTDTTRYKSIATEGKTFVQQNFDWKNINQKLSALMEGTIHSNNA